jgi:hypothetical protein
MMLRLTVDRRASPLRWIARWALALTVSLTLAADAAA